MSDCTKQLNSGGFDVRNHGVTVFLAIFWKRSSYHLQSKYAKGATMIKMLSKNINMFLKTQNYAYIKIFKVFSNKCHENAETKCLKKYERTLK
jgi:hypothetical protein